jgi:glucoamylase
MTAGISIAPGWPGLSPRWSSAAKSGVGTSVGHESRVWFTVSHGILNEVSYPRVDQACTRDLGLIVTDGREFFSEEKRHADHSVAWLADGVPAFRLTNTCTLGRYRIEKEVLTDPRRHTLLQKVRFHALQGAPADYHLYALLAPHLGNRGAGNTAWVDEYKGVPMLFAEREGHALALACSAPWLRRSAGFVGASDGWQDLTRNGVMAWQYDRAENGNVALTGEIDLSAAGEEFVLALAFGRTAAEAGQQARASLLDGFAAARDLYIRDWQRWLASIAGLEGGNDALDGRPRGLRYSAVELGARDLFRASAAIMRTHEAKHRPTGSIAALATPWGQAKGDDDLGGYHLVWPRDMAETAGGLLAAGAREDVHQMLHFLEATQEADGHWPQNMWLDGTPYWTGIQMDETAFPILLVEMARREGALEEDDEARFWAMTRRAAAFVVKNGPVSPQDRWEEDPGLSPFTLAVEIAALLAAADHAEVNGEGSIALYLRETADAWNDGIERWIYVSDTDLARAHGVRGYYVRIAPPEGAEAASLNEGWVPIKNRPVADSSAPAESIVSPDALALVRFGLRAPDDPRIADTVTVIDALLKVETPFGPAWHRYNDDGYGEHEDGEPFDGTGIGRAWPLLTGERAHYELAAGRRDEALRLLRALEAFAGDGGLLPEQVWDAADIPDKELFFGRPSGSATPLVWAHAEYVKLRRSLADGRVFDMPQQTVQRYLVERRQAAHASWRLNNKCRACPAGRTLRIEAARPATVRWSADDWRTSVETEARDTGIGMFVADLPTTALAPGTTVRFTIRWADDSGWEGADFAVQIVS